MILRYANSGDIPALNHLLRQVLQVHHGGRPDIFRIGAQKYSASQVLAMLDDPMQPIFIAAEGDHVFFKVTELGINQGIALPLGLVHIVRMGEKCHVL